MSATEKAYNASSTQLTSILKDHLLARTLEDILLDSILSNEAIHVDVTLLSNAMGSGHRLQVILWIPSLCKRRQIVSIVYELARYQYRLPITVKDDDGVGSLEIDTETSCAG